MSRKLMVAALAATLAGGVHAQATGRTVVISSAPVLGGTLGLQVRYPASQAGNPYGMQWSAPYAGTTNLGLFFLQGLLRLDPAFVGTLYTGTFDATGAVTVNIPVPNSVALLGVTFDAQSVDANLPLLTAYLSDNDVTPYVCNCIGRTIMTVGTISSLTTGDLTIGTIDQSLTLAASAVPVSSFQILRHGGQDGTVEGYAATFSSTVGNSDPATWSRTRVSRNLINQNVQTIALPNGYDVAYLRDKANVSTCYIVSIKQSDGSAKVLATYTNSVAVAASSTAFFQPMPGFSNDGSLMCVIVKDSATTASAGPDDQVWLVKTDGSTWASSGTPVLNLTPGGTVSHQFSDQAVVMCNGRVFVGFSAAGVGNWFTADFTDSATNKLVPVSVPNTGTNKPNVALYVESRRVSADGKTFITHIGGDLTSSMKENDVIAFTNISGAGYSIKNITGFTTPTNVMRFGQSAITATTTQNSSTGLRASLSPDGTRFAFLSGDNTATLPTQLYVVKVDGSQAGTLTPVSAGQFDPQVVGMTEPKFVNNDTVCVFAGGATTTSGFGNLDLYAYTVSSNTWKNLTKTTTGATTPPFTAGGTTGNILERGTFSAPGGKWWYFVRSYLTTATTYANNIVGVDAATVTLKDITGSEFSAGTAPAIYRSCSLTGLAYTADPWFALEFQLRHQPGGPNAFFVAENAAGAGPAAFNDSNVFRFDLENGGQAVQLTGYAATGGTVGAVSGINHLTVSPDGKHLAYARRLLTASGSEDVVAIPAAGGTPKQLSLSASFGATQQNVSDGSIFWTCLNGTVWGVSWVLGTGSQAVPTANTVAQWALVNGSMSAPLNLTAPPAPTPAKVLQPLGGNSTP